MAYLYQIILYIFHTNPNYTIQCVIIEHMAITRKERPDKKPKIISLFFIILGTFILFITLIAPINKTFVWHGLFLISLGLTVLPLSTEVKK